MTEINKWHDVNGHFFSDCEMEMIRESIKINIHVLEKGYKTKSISHK